MTRVLEFMSSDEHRSQVASLPLRGLLFFFSANHNNLTQSLCRRAKQKSEPRALAPPPPRWTFKPERFFFFRFYFHTFTINRLWLIWSYLVTTQSLCCGLSPVMPGLFGVLIWCLRPGRVGYQCRHWLELVVVTRHPRGFWESPR